MNRRTASRGSLARELRHTRMQLAAERAARRAAEEREAARHYQATHDQLTGLLNREGLNEAWQMYAPNLPAVALLDLDDFKPVNDRYGHAAGNLVLQETARRLTGHSGCTPARLHGDEFAAILPAAGAVETACAIGARLAQPIHIGDSIDVIVSASIGVTFAAAGVSLPVLLAQADAAMYRDKHTKGCDERVAVYEPRRDDHTALKSGARPDIRTRNLKPVDRRGMPAHPYPVAEVAR